MTVNLSRRTFLRGTGVAMALPMLDAMLPRAYASALAAGDAAGPAATHRRMVCICTGLGIHGPNLFPEQAGRDYTLTPYLQTLAGHRNDFSILSGVSHPDVDGGHHSESSYLTTAPHPGSSNFRNTVSLDQVIAEKMGAVTRFGYLALGTARSSLSVTRSGTQIPSDKRPSQLFKKLFLSGTEKEVQDQVRRLKEGQSIMDTVLERTRTLQKDVGSADRQRLDEYFTSVREVEHRLSEAEAWATRPKPKVNVKPPVDIANGADIIGRTRLMYDLIHLAIQTDSTRVITLSIDGMNSVPPVEGVTIDHHNLSHHGKDETKLAQLRIVELEQMKAFADLVTKLKQTQEQGGSLLDRTMVMYGSNLGNASSHDTRNMPIILAGGGFRHGQHLAFDKANNAPLGNLFVSMLQQIGVDADSFGTGRGTLKGLEPVPA